MTKASELDGVGALLAKTRLHDTRLFNHDAWVAFSSARGKREPYDTTQVFSVTASGYTQAYLLLAEMMPVSSSWSPASTDAPSMIHPEVLANLLQSYICATGERSHS